MVRYSLALAAIVGAIGLADAAVPVSRPADPPMQPPLMQSYIVFFETGKAGLTPEARQILQSAARQAHAMRQAKLRVMMPGGGEAALMQKRARILKTELVRDGVKPRNIDNADKPQNVDFTNGDPVLRAWLDRSATIEILPLPASDSVGQVG